MSFAFQYMLWVFGASCGVLQIAAAASGLRGLSFFSRPLWGYLAGSALVIASFAWFYGTADRNAVGPPYQTPQQTQIIYAGAAVLAALAFTLATCSVIRRGTRGCAPSGGLESLRHCTYSELLRSLPARRPARRRRS